MNKKTKQNLKKSLVGIVLIVAFALFLLGCEQQEEVLTKNVLTKDEVTVGFKKNLPYLPLFVGMEKGYFADERLQINTVVFDTTNQMLTAIALGQADATLGGANLEALLSLEEKNPGAMKVFSIQRVTDSSRISCALVKKDSSLRSVKDLEGKIVGTLPGSFAPLWIKATLKHYGMQENTVLIQGIAPELQLPALEEGSIDALFTGEPTCTFAVNKRVGRIIEEEPLKYLTKTFAASVLSTKLLQERPETAKRLVQATDKSLKFIREHPEEALDILAKHTGYKRELLQGIKIPTYATSTEVSPRDLAEVEYTFLQQGILKKEVNSEKMVLGK